MLNPKGKIKGLGSEVRTGFAMGKPEVKGMKTRFGMACNLFREK